MDNKLWYVEISFFKDEQLTDISKGFAYIVKTISEKDAQLKVLSRILSHSAPIYSPSWYIEEIIETPYEV